MKQLIIIVLVFGFSLSSLSQSGNSVIASAGGQIQKPVLIYHGLLVSSWCLLIQVTI